MALQYFLQNIKNEEERWRVVNHTFIEGNPPSFVPLKTSIAAGVFPLLKRFNIHQLYRHQLEALKALRKGKHLVVSTPTASGKSLIYQIAIAEKIVTDPGAKALLIFPIKALSRDQLQSAREFFSGLLSEKAIAVYDGDTAEKERAEIRKNTPSILITNPDMLHYGLLPYHAKWQKLWQDLKFVVIDEMHSYRGVFGSHVSLILRRLRRICKLYGSSPQFLSLSATIGNPLELASQLTGISPDDLTLVASSAAPSPPRHILFITTDLPLAVTAALLTVRSIRKGLKTIVFTRSRRMTELIYLTIKRRFPDVSRLVSSYRAGLLPSDRRFIEEAINCGNLRGVIATSALELGIDIGDLDVCILVGYPGTVMTTWQRAGRVGRGGQESAVILIPQNDALDHYIISHPGHVLSGEYETAVADVANPEILRDHLLCAAAEIPITEREVNENPGWFDVVGRLKALGLLHRGEEGSYKSRYRYPHRDVDIRQVGQSFTIFLDTKGKKPVAVGSIDGVRVFKECHPGAVYLHLGDTYIVRHLDIERRNVWITPFDGPYFTAVTVEKETSILEIIKSRPLHNFVIRAGRIRVTEQVTGYDKKSTGTMEIIDHVELELPPQSYETVGFWIEVDGWIEKVVRDAGRHFMGGLHALEHAIISMFPLFLLCDRNDIGGIATPYHPQVQKSAVFIYDGYPGGIGLCRRAFDMIEDILKRVEDLLKECDCTEGCPRCIQSPKCGSGNKPLDKDAALLIVRALTDPDMLVENSEAEPTSRATEPVILHRSPQKYNIAFFDLETQKLAHEVGGWHNCHLMRVSVAVLYDMVKERFLVYREDEIEDLIKQFQTYELIVGFNIKRFDYRVLMPYSTIDLQILPTFDILEEVSRVLGFRLSLDHLAAATLGSVKRANGIQAVKWFREGRWEELVSYCIQDVALTRDLFLFGLRNGHLKFRGKRGSMTKIPVNWSLEELLETSKEMRSRRSVLP
ncbi:DEAD/DEAH box helicase [Thermodesulforhabdus norvegica]|uniref:DEAD/DEAH box helicase domain-containing protein n=1 Tax=Thermodesulforhabdus norvegica TaxID=39841 RepID=A0A1I4T5H8_9BACT|nr:DEAD/DEAH box helicase [Thermodesulforhabdus norvegica]SFM71901.1 DEAD/DEAH box helicase domain-containing protein [Thermodesulforhabdus norvegica]